MDSDIMRFTQPRTLQRMADIPSREILLEALDTTLCKIGSTLRFQHQEIRL